LQHAGFNPLLGFEFERRGPPIGSGDSSRAALQPITLERAESAGPNFASASRIASTLEIQA
jgi:hypothetical protein